MEAKVFILAIFAVFLNVSLSVRLPIRGSIHGDICVRVQGRKFYLEEGAVAFVYAKNVSYIRRAPPINIFQRVSRRHRKRAVPPVVAQRLPISSLELLERLSRSKTIEKFYDFEVNFENEFENIIQKAEKKSLGNEVEELEGENEIIEENQDLIAIKNNSSIFTSSQISTKKINETHDSTTEEEKRTVTSKPVTPVILTTEPFIQFGNLPIKKCGMELFTCAECHLELQIKNVNLPRCSIDKSCLCDYLQIREPPYLNSGSQDVCGVGLEAETFIVTQTRHVAIDFFFQHSFENAFEIIVTAKKNVHSIVGTPTHRTGLISTPFFPELYPNEHWMEYTLQSKDKNDVIKLSFIDFHLSPWSYVAIYDTNKSRIAAFTGNTFRPPVLVSSGPSVTVLFTANGETDRGFKLRYNFIDSSNFEAHLPLTDCGGYVTNFGGVITMLNMTSANSSVDYDCVWIIEPPQDYAFKTHLLLKVVHFDHMEEGSILEVRQGKTSEDYLLQTSSIDNSFVERNIKEHVVAIDTGFYVRLKARFNTQSKLAIVYTSFSYLGSCYQTTDLMCHNHRCIPKMLRCDGFDHCGDNSDESKSCFQGRTGTHNTKVPKQNAWNHNSPNYYFPQKRSLISSETSSGILLLFTLFCLVLILVGLLSYMFRQTIVTQNETRRINRERRTNNDPFNDGVTIVDASADDPPLYEAPPDYEDVLKFILSGEKFNLVKHSGGTTAWIADGKSNIVSLDNQTLSGMPTLKLTEVLQQEESLWASDTLARRTRHASLELDSDGWNTYAEPCCPTPFSKAVPSNIELILPENKLSLHEVIAGSSFTEMPLQRSSSLPLNTTSLKTMIQKHDITTFQPKEITFNKDHSPKHLLRLPPTTSNQSFHSSTDNISIRSNQKLLNRKSSSTRRGKKTTKKKCASPIPSNCLPPSYEMVLEQKYGKANANYLLQKSDQTNGVKFPIIRRNSCKRNSTIIRVKNAREKFKKLDRGEQVLMNEDSVAGETMDVSSEVPEPLLISEGIVEKVRKQLLENIQFDCDCHGACSCGIEKNASISDIPFTDVDEGIVQNKIEYYGSIEKKKPLSVNSTSNIDDAKFICESNNYGINFPQDINIETHFPSEGKLDSKLKENKNKGRMLIKEPLKTYSDSKRDSSFNKSHSEPLIGSTGTHLDLNTNICASKTNPEIHDLKFNNKLSTIATDENYITKEKNLDSPIMHSPIKTDFTSFDSFYPENLKGSQDQILIRSFEDDEEDLRLSRKEVTNLNYKKKSSKLREIFNQRSAAVVQKLSFSSDEWSHSKESSDDAVPYLTLEGDEKGDIEPAECNDDQLPYEVAASSGAIAKKSRVFRSVTIQL